MQIQSILETQFGLQSFRPQQKEIIEHVIDGNDALVIMPTGGGKSLCYQIPALALPGCAVVISPLIALMNDQMAALKQLGIAAGAIHSQVDPLERSRISQQLSNGELKLLYVSPEKIGTPDFRALLQSMNISLFAIDEAHCVSVWGNDFRPDYVQLSYIKKTFPKTPVIGLTATADSTTQDDIIHQLGIEVKEPYLSSFERENIHMSIAPGLKRMEQIVKFVQQKKSQAGIIYCLSRKNTEKVAQKLVSLGLRAKSYHAGMPGQERASVQQEFQNDEIDIVCATIAFGMGIDKPNIRFVIHFNLPKNIEGYYQEIGRAGRDGLPAETLLFSSWGDFINLQRFIDDSDANDSFKIVQRAKLERMWQFASTISCRTNFILNYFGEFNKHQCNHCDNCLNPPEFIDGTLFAQMALSGIIRSKSILGVNGLIDLLRGIYSEEIKRNEFHNLKTFGVGRKLSFNQWRHYIEQFINNGIIHIDYIDHFRLKATPLSGDILSGKSQVKVSEFVSLDKKRKEKIQKPALDLSEVDGDKLSILKKWRLQQATNQQVPAYVIFPDKTLQLLSSLEFKNQEELLAVDGIGPVKLERYGQQLIELLN